jgi:hypothetical protein
MDTLLRIVTGNGRVAIAPIASALPRQMRIGAAKDENFIDEAPILSIPITQVKKEAQSVSL